MAQSQSNESMPVGAMQPLPAPLPQPAPATQPPGRTPDDPAPVVAPNSPGANENDGPGEADGGS